MKATAKELRFNSKKLLDSVSRGEDVVITYRGKPCARLVPIEDNVKRKSRYRSKLFGLWKDNTAVDNVEKYVRDLRKDRYPCS